MDQYAIPVTYLLTHVLKSEIIKAPPITSKTVELGNKYSPEFVCTPFKYTLGTLIECLEKGANLLIQSGGGCRYGYYHELQEQILKDLGYSFEFVNLVSGGSVDIPVLLKKIKKIEPHFSMLKGIHYIRITKLMIYYMDKIDDYIRENIGFEVEEGSFLNLKKRMLAEMQKVKSRRELKNVYYRYRKRFHEIELDKPKDPLKVGIIGELYTVMEPFSNYELEKALAKKHIQIKRYTNVTYLLFQKGKMTKRMLKKAKEYVKYKMGADAMDNIARTKYLCTHGYDGIIHIKSSFCTPEIGAMPIIQKICNDYQIPVLFFSFDLSTSEVGIETRLEAFYDMLEMRKNACQKDI